MRAADQTLADEVALMVDDLHPRVAEVGWRQALGEFTGAGTVERFYARFDAFWALPAERRLERAARIR